MNDRRCALNDHNYHNQQCDDEQRQEQDECWAGDDEFEED